MMTTTTATAMTTITTLLHTALNRTNQCQPKLQWYDGWWQFEDLFYNWKEGFYVWSRWESKENMNMNLRPSLEFLRLTWFLRETAFYKARWTPRKKTVFFFSVKLLRIGKGKKIRSKPTGDLRMFYRVGVLVAKPFDIFIFFVFTSVFYRRSANKENEAIPDVIASRSHRRSGPKWMRPAIIDIVIVSLERQWRWLMVVPTHH